MAVNERIFVIWLTSVDRSHAAALNGVFTQADAYLGAVEVDNTYLPHVVLYSHGLCPFGRIHGQEFSLFWDESNEASKDFSALAKLKECGFQDVAFESLNGRYSIFDRRHTPEQTVLFGETQKLCERLLADTAERVLNALTDIAPALPEKLHAALSAYANATSSERIAHTALSCRRILEYIADCLFPPQSQGPLTGRKLDKQAYRNRLLAYADVARASDSSIDLIVVSTETLGEQLTRLDSAVNKGVHADLLDVEGRRCLVRTIMLLDDLVSLKSSPFQMVPELVSLKSFLKGRRDET